MQQVPLHAVCQPRSSSTSSDSKDLNKVEEHHMGMSCPTKPSSMVTSPVCRMPSTHASACTFFAVSVLLSSLYLPLHSSLHSFAAFAPLVVVPWAATINLSRVWLGYHTWRQVMGGVGFGICFAVLWFKMWAEDIGGIATIGRVLECDVTSRVMACL